MGEIVKSIMTGIVSGVAAGVVLTWFLEQRSRERRCLERKEQIEHFSKMIVNFEKDIFGPPRFPVLAALRPLEQRRKTSYEIFRKRLESALDGRANRLHFDEIEHLRIIFLDEFNWQKPDFTPSEEWYSQRFGMAVSLKWLELPQMTRNYGG